MTTTDARAGPQTPDGLTESWAATANAICLTMNKTHWTSLTGPATVRLTAGTCAYSATLVAASHGLPGLTETTSGMTTDTLAMTTTSRPA